MPKGYHNSPGRGNHRGALNTGAKLNDEMVRDIRKRRAAGETRRSIAESYGLHPRYISDIATRKVWSWLK